ncbi:MAG: cytochrome-c oxidase, cbb3-type subunit III [Pseudohongiellaceae bacterium]
MANLPSNFWNGWIIVITLVSLAAVMWLVVSVYFSPDARKGHADDEGPVWDDTLKEGRNAPPLWWFWLILGSTIFSLLYLMLYPGLGFYPGLLNWDQGSRVSTRYAEFQASFSTTRDNIAAMSLIEIQNDIALMDTAERIYQRECSACHGVEARGQVSQFPNLMDVDWQWGASAEAIEQSIRNGRNAIMAPWEGILNETQIRNVATYVQQLQQLQQPPTADNPPGKTTFDQYCVVCHTADGTGNPLLGAPNLTDNIWLYGGDTTALIQTISKGRNGTMPAFNQRLDDTQIHLLVALLAR